GLYRSTDNGDTWGSPLVTVPSGNNIFSIALNPTTPTQTIFAGTRNGPLRSTDNGVTWSPAINGIPPNSWVRDIEVDSGGIVVAATTNGIFSSTNNGDLWEQATGVTDTIVKIIFDYPLITDNLGGDTRMLAGSDNGQLVEAFASNRYLTLTLAALLDPSKEFAGIWIAILKNENEKKHGVAMFPRNNGGGGYYESTDNGQTWNQENTGLPGNAKTSALTGLVVETRATTQINEYVGLFENTNGGARIFKRETVVSVEKVNDLTPVDYILNQNYPNPFNPTTNIKYSIPQASFVQLIVYDILGNEVATLVNEEQTAGIYRADFNGEGLASGLYIAKLTVGNFIQTIKMSLLK
ncbi:MAG: T9SS type A sorting domain-containing protein, partial [Ignavibacteriaceae bacterium]